MHELITAKTFCSPRLTLTCECGGMGGGPVGPADEESLPVIILLACVQ